MTKVRNKNKGFTLIELLVVISIIGLLSSIVLANLSSARERALNARMVLQIDEYIKAFTLYEYNTGAFPYTTDEKEHCIGTGYPDGKCGWIGTESVSTESPELNNLLAPYIKPKALNLYSVPFKIQGSEATLYYMGFTYSCSVYTYGKCYNPILFWALFNENQPCAGGARRNSFGGSTLCYIKFNDALSDSVCFKIPNTEDTACF